MGGALIQRWLTTGCSDPTCYLCPLRRRRRELVFAGVVGGAVAAFLLSMLLLGLQLIGVK